MAKLDEQPRTAKKAVKTTADVPKSELRGRDLIYIDTDDDVTSIVEKIKASTEAVVALVPPKRIGVLQSVVNLKLLQRAAKLAHKRLAIVTVDPALTNLASGLAIPVAKSINAQAKVPDMNEGDDVSDVIDGNDLNVTNAPRRRSGDSGETDDKEISAAVAAIETDDRIKNDLDANGIPDDEEGKGPYKKPAKKVKVPSINDLRKKIIIGGAAAVVLIGFLVWAFVFAPQTVITIKAKTSPVDVKQTLSLTPSAKLDADKGAVASVVKQKKTNESVDFNATGQKEVGEKASGKVSVCLAKDPFNSRTGAKNEITIPAGTLLYASGVQYTLDSDLTVQGGISESTGKCDSDATWYTTGATAVNIGPDANIAKGTTVSVSGFEVTAETSTEFTGGSKEIVKVVQQADVDKAVEELKKKGDNDAIKDELEEQMSNSTVVIANSFTVSQGDVKVSPAVGEAVGGGSQPSVSVEITYTLVGVSQSDLKEVLAAQIKAEIDDKEQKIYSDGLDDIDFSNFAGTNNGYTVVIKTKAHVGPVIDENEVKKNAVGKKTEEIKAQLKQTDGVSDVEVTMSPFWVHSAPSENKIKINFTIDE
ncbi:MAG: hypothetical protein Q4C83_00700 [Candidatus Saccharibacteria bacterium]|nr:hypothetical protein [Candidatus Saccharibacteria bacterium]